MASGSRFPANSRQITRVELPAEDPDVTRFLANSRPRAALKRLKHLGRGASAEDVLRVVLCVAKLEQEAWRNCEPLMREVLTTAGEHSRLEPSHRQTLRVALEARNFEHWAVSRTGRRPVASATRGSSEAHPRTFVDPNARLYN